MTDQSRQGASTLTTHVFHAKTTTFLATWNVRTLYLYDRLEQVIKEMIKYKIYILTLCEMRWTGSGKMKEDRKTIIYSGISKEHILGVGICSSSPVAKALIGWKPVNKRIITVRFQTRHAKVTIISAHAPTMKVDDSKKDNFCKTLQNVIDEIPLHDIKLLMGDFDAQIGKSRQGMESTIGLYGSSNIINDKW